MYKVKFGKDYYTQSGVFDRKSDANKEATRLRKTGIWLARIKKTRDGYILFVRPKN